MNTSNNSISSSRGYKLIRSEVRATEQGHVAEEAFFNADGKCIGYWAYGHFDPAYEFQGNELEYLTSECKRYRDAIKEAIEHAGGREDEWGERAKECFLILERAVSS